MAWSKQFVNHSQCMSKKDLKSSNQINFNTTSLTMSLFQIMCCVLIACCKQPYTCLLRVPVNIQ